MTETIYLDNAATTFPKPKAVYEAMDFTNRKSAVNAGRGSYLLAQEATSLISDSKKGIRSLISADDSVPVIFSPSITVALNQIIQGYPWKDNSFVYVSPYEHNAVLRTISLILSQHNLNLRELPLDSKTLEIDLEKTKYVFSKAHPAAVFCTHVSNVTGYILPINEVFAEAKKYSALTVLDSAQSLGLINIDLRVQRDIDIIAFTAHKCLYGPFGIGGFINVANAPLNPVIVGGTGSDSLNLDMPNGNEGRYESASTNIVAVSGLKAALDNLNVEQNYKHELHLTQYLSSKLETFQNVDLFAPINKDNHIGIVSFAVHGMKSDDVGMILDEDFGIAVRTGYHCAAFIHKYLKDEKYLGTIRVGLGQFTTEKEIDVLLEALLEM